MTTAIRQFRVAAAQIEAVFYDAQANLARILAAIEEAAAGGARLVVFSELALSGYPFHIWTLSYGEQLPLITDFYTKAAVEADGPEMESIRACCTKNAIRAVVGFCERDGGSLYMSQWLVGPDGGVVMRRKLRPTSLERIVFGDGDGSDIKVHKTELGNVGVLQCWEHAQSLLKYAMSSQHEEVHCASWPVFPAELPHHSLSRESNAALLTAYAIETGTFVVSASSFLTAQNLEKVFGAKEKVLSTGGGYTTILDPEGRTLAVAKPDQNEIVYANVDVDLCYKARSVLDPTGHYSRTDVFEVHFDMTPRHIINIAKPASRSSAPSPDPPLFRQLRRTMFDQPLAANTHAKRASAVSDGVVAAATETKQDGEGADAASAEGSV
ncbi:aliphatic nitrilase [Rhodotorula toruloides]|uniref:Aliphatic nitrilase n=1 Tax=Rhodotorula toruloides TaxID=5286 RepID=A0A511KRB4_RHOTO|nr:aliphatic nitrilase [Rhodotorula toruloides]